jgi:hypothetical protein
MAAKRVFISQDIVLPYKQMRKLIFLAVLISSCSARYTPTDQSVSIKTETRKMLDSRIAVMAGLQTDSITYYFILNRNKSFAAIAHLDNEKKYDFRAGTFESNADTLDLSYYGNYKSNYFSDKAIIDNANGEIIFLSADSTKNRKIKFLDQL